MLTLLARFAEDESHSISGNVKWTIRNQFRDGTYRQTIAPYGYGWEDHALRIIPEEAAVVKRIFGMVLAGSGMNRIAQTLNSENIPSPNGGDESPACYDYDDFFRRTSTIRDSDVIGDGQIESFSNETVVKYLEKVIVQDDGYEVWFKAEVSVSITTE